jgi:glycosyltransferase involved in cell wall biosynthesis
LAARNIVAFDNWILQERYRCSGLYAYGRALLAELERIAPLHGVSIKTFALPGSSGSGFSTRMLAHDRLWRLGAGDWVAGRVGADILFDPVGQSFPGGRVPHVATIHDTTPIVVPTDRWRVRTFMRTLMWSVAHLSEKIITDSENSKRDILRCYSLPPEKIQVVYPGCDHCFFQSAAPGHDFAATLLARFGIHRPYVIHHGTVHERKNLLRLISAYQTVIEKRPEWGLQLILVGPPGWGHREILSRAQSINDAAKGRVAITGALPREELLALLQGAALCVIPSLNEGFCLPMVEAMACGVPTIASRTSCLPEVSGQALRYFDPLAQEDIAQCMMGVLDDSALQEELRSRGRARAVEFSWEKCAAETLRVLLAAISEARACSLRGFRDARI